MARCDPRLFFSERMVGIACRSEYNLPEQITYANTNERQEMPTILALADCIIAINGKKRLK